MISAGQIRVQDLTGSGRPPVASNIPTIDRLPQAITMGQQQHGQYYCGAGWLNIRNTARSRRTVRAFLQGNCVTDVYALYADYMSGRRGERPGVVLTGLKKVHYENIAGRALMQAFFVAQKWMVDGRRRFSVRTVNHANGIMAQFATGSNNRIYELPTTSGNITLRGLEAVLAFARRVALRGGRMPGGHIIMPFPPNVITFANKLGGKLGAQFLRLYTDLMKRAPKRMQTDFSRKAQVYRERAGDSLIATVKTQLNFTNPLAIPADRRPTMEKRLAATLGHKITGTVTINGNNVQSTVRVHIKELGRDVRGGLIRSNDDYKTIDAKRGLLNDAYYLRFEKQIGRKPEGIRGRTLLEAARLMRIKLTAFVRAFARKYRMPVNRVDLRDIRVTGISTGRRALRGLRGTHDVITDIRFGLAKGIPGDVVYKLVLSNPLVRDKYLGIIALKRIWKEIVDKDPRADSDPKIRRYYANKLKDPNGVLARRIRQNERTKRHVNMAGQPDGARVLMNTYVKGITGVRSQTPRPQFITTGPGFNRPRMPAFSEDATKDVMRRYVLIPVFKKAKDGRGNSIRTPNTAQKDAIEREAAKVIIKVLRNPKYASRRMEALMGITINGVTVKPRMRNGHPVRDEDGRPVYDVHIDYTVDPNSRGKRDVGGNAHVFAIARVGPSYATKAGLNPKKPPVGGYLFGGAEWMRPMGPWSIGLGAKMLVLSDTGFLSTSFMVPHQDRASNSAFVRFNPYVAVGRKLGNAWTARLDAGAISARGFFLDNTAFDSSSHAHEVSNLPDSSSIGGLALWAAGKINKQFTLKVGAKFGRTYSLLFDPNKTFGRSPTSWRVVGSIMAAAALLNQRLTLEAGLTVDYASGVQKPVSDGMGSESTAEWNALGVIFDLGLGYLLVKKPKHSLRILASLRNYHEVRWNQAPANANRLEAGAGIRYRYGWRPNRAVSFATNVNYFQQQNIVNWNEYIPSPRGGSDGIHDGTGRGVTVDGLLLFHTGSTRYSLGFGPFVNFGYDALSGQKFYTGGAHFQGTFDN